MRLLLDTHTFLWFVLDDPQLSPTVKRLLMDGRNERLLSIASVWEMAIKVNKGQLKVAEPYRTFLPEQLERHRVTILPIEVDQAVCACDMPYGKFANGDVHKDPFDRMIVLQSKITSIPLLSNEEVFEQYGIHRIW